jgi:hypothetical protein
VSQTAALIADKMVEIGMFAIEVEVGVGDRDIYDGAG